jgi:hypothetical protein
MKKIKCNISKSDNYKTHVISSIYTFYITQFYLLPLGIMELYVWIEQINNKIIMVVGMTFMASSLVNLYLLNINTCLRYVIFLMVLEI